MAMLAEPRRKQKVINLRAKNNAWSNDSTKFGQRMLEKMGWTSGKGLGANESGITQHVVARYKNDEKGLGFEDKNDQWTKHEDDFNALLANLSNATDNSENLHSGVSLEDKSKKSKARIHYHKFTRGKDISRYSEKDLANIFGKKSFKNTDILKEPLKEDLKTREQVFTEKGSMIDYFKRKLAGIKSKSTLSVSNVTENADCNESDYGFHGFSQNTDHDTTVYKGFGYNQEDKIDYENSSKECGLVSATENAKKKKFKSTSNLEQIKNDNECSKDMPPEQECYQQNEQCVEEAIKKKKKSKNKNRKTDMHEEESNNLNVCGDSEQNNSDVKKKKKSKHKDISSDIRQNNDDTENKKRLSKVKEIFKNPVQYDSEMVVQPNNLDKETTKNKKSKRKRHQNVDNTTEKYTEEDIRTKKKKRKNLD